MRTPKRLQLLSLLLLLSAPLCAQDTSADSRPLTLDSFSNEPLIGNTDTAVVEVEVTGLRKTKKRAIEPLIRLKRGEPLTQQRFTDTQQSLKQTGLFEPIEFYYRESPEGYKVRIDLSEKATLVPIPFFSASDGDYSFGMALFEANLLGLRRQLVASAIIADWNPYGSIGLIDPTLLESTATWVIFLSGGSNIREAAFPDGDNYRVFRGTDARVSTRLSMRTREKLQPSLAFKYEQSDVESDWSESIAPPDGSSIIVPEAGFTYEDTYFLEYFYRGFLAQLSYGYGFQMDTSYEGPGGNGSIAEASAELSGAFFGDHRLSVTAKGGFSELPVPNLDELVGSGFRVLPFRRAVGRSYAAGSLEYELPFYRPGWGTFTLTAFFDGGIYEPRKDQWSRFYGPGGGFRLYLSRVAIPAVGADLAVNLPTGTLQTSIVVGMRM